MQRISVLGALNKISVAVMILVLLSGCGKLIDRLCGGPFEKQKTFLESVNKEFACKFSIEHVPCYSDYVRINLTTDYDKHLVDSLEAVYNDTVGFAEFLVYTEDGKLVRGNTGSM